MTSGFFDTELNKFFKFDILCLGDKRKSYSLWKGKTTINILLPEMLISIVSVNVKDCLI